MPYIADNSYLAIKPETTPGVAVIPTVFVPLVSESIKTVVNHSADRRMKGMDWKSDDLLRGNRTHEGDIVVLGDPDSLGHFLNMVMAKGITTGDAANGYTHPFTVGAPKTYTIEIKKGLYAQRYCGVLINDLKLAFADGQLEITASIMAQAQVSISSVGVALTGAGMTSLTLDDEYDISPNRGLVIGDVINVGGVDLTLTSVSTNGHDVGFTSTSVTASIGAPVYLKPQTVSLPSLQDPLYFGNSLVGIADTSANADTAAATRATATPIYDFVMSIKNNLYAANGSTRMDPVQILTRTKEAQIEVKQLFENVEQRQSWMDRVKQAITVIMLGKFIKADFSTQEKLTLKLNKVKLIDNDNAVNVGDHIVDDQKFEVLYDSGDAAAMTVSLVNRTAGTAY
jgi:hypothetical protein